MRTGRAMSIVEALSRLGVSVLVSLVRAYQVTLSPHLGNCCRFTPSCSNYCIEALRVHGVFKGCWLTFKRLMRCRPFGPSGYDPVPPKRTKNEENEKR